MNDRRPEAAVFAWDNGRGLTRDLGIVLELLEAAGYDATVRPVTKHLRGALYRAKVRRLIGRPVRDLNLFLESVVPAEFHRARHNVLIPNQEWFEPSDLRFLPFLDVVACRSHLTAELFANRGPRTEYVGFTSADRSVAGVPKGDGILHIAGHSLFKGTEALLRVWQRHPEWPCLTLVHRPEVAPVVEGIANIMQLTEHVPDQELKQLQQEAWLHIQPSEAEGFGHCLCEGMSAAAVVLTVDAAPMNELVRPERGVLVPWSGAEPMGVDRRYFVDEARLEESLAALLSGGPGSVLAMMQGARDWYLQNDIRFRQAFITLCHSFVRPRHR